MSRVTPAMLCFALALNLFSRPAWGQRATASISGLVTDSSGAPVPGATVTVKNRSTSVERTAITNNAGFYSITALPAGTYSLTVAQQGFSTFSVPEIVLQVDQNATGNAQLQLGTVSETITVEDAVAAVDTRNSTLNTVINSQMVNDLPLNGRNVLQLLSVTPGTLNTSGTFNQAATRPESSSQLVSASGGRGNSTTFILDGGIHEDPYTEVANVLPNPDAIQEFSYQTNNYGAKFAGRGGGVVNVVTRSGTNEIHGSVFEYLRNSRLNERNYFAATNDGLKRNQYGFSLGGPLKRNQTFLFGSWQGTQIRSLPSTLTAVVPTAQQREGNFSAMSKQLVDPETGDPFPGNIIPASRLDPVALKVLQMIPVATSADGLLRYSRGDKQTDNQVLARVDHHIGSAHHISGRFFWDELNVPAVLDRSNILTALPDRRWLSLSAVANYTWTVGPSVLTNTTLSYNRTSNIAFGPTFPATARSASTSRRYPRATHSV